MKYVFSFLLIFVFCFLLVPSNVVAIDNNEYYNNIDNVKLNKIDETDNYTIYNIDFLGGNRSKINGALFVPFNSNGNGVVVLNGIGAPIDTIASYKLVTNGYTVLACYHRGSGKSEGYLSTKYMPLDVMKQITILENLDKINENLPTIQNIGIYGHCIAGNIAMETITLDPRIDAATISAFNGSLYEASMSMVFSSFSMKEGESIFLTEMLKGLKMESSLMYSIVDPALSVLSPLMIKIIPETAGDKLSSLVFNIPKGPVSMLDPLFLSPISNCFPEGSERAGIKFISYIVGSAAHSGFDYAKQIEIPIMYIHGENDIEIPFEWSEIAFNSTSSKEKELVIIPNANHSYMTPEGDSLVDDVLSNTVDWFNKHL